MIGMDRFVTDRNRYIAQGGIGLVIVVALVTIGIKYSFGAFDGGYRLSGSFAAAGQGLIDGSDVKIRGINVGSVSGIDLVENRAVITMRIDDGTQIPVDAQAVIRPKTLFGEKFVDILPGDAESTGPFLTDGDVIEDTLGGFELEQVLTDAFPVIEAIDGVELAVVLGELARSGEGLGPNINDSIVNAAVLTELGVSNDAEFRQFTSDLALLSETLDRVAPDVVAGARDLNVALPTLVERSDQLNALLVEGGRLASELADLLEANEGFLDAALDDGSRGLQVLFDRRDRIQPLVRGLTDYTGTIARALRFEVGDGTLMAAVKNLVSTVAVTGAAEGTPLEPVADLVPGVAPDVPQVPLAVAPDADEMLAALLGGGR